MKQFSAHFKKYESERIQSVSIEGSMTAMSAINFKQDLISRIEKSNEDFHIDISQLRAMDVAGVNALAMAHKKINNLGRKLILISDASNPAHEFLHLTKFMDYFEFRRA